MERSRLALSRAAIVGIIVVLVIIGGAAYFFTQPLGPRLKSALRVGTTDSVASTIDPAEAYDYFGVNVIQNIGEGLWVYAAETGELRNQLAKDLQISPDRKTWTVTIIDNAKFNGDATPLRAEHFKFAWDRTIRLEKDPSFLIADILEKDKIQVLGDFQLRFTLKQPFEETYVKALLATWVAYPLNPKNTPANALIEPTNWPDTVGPYQVTRWVKDEFIEFSAGANYYGPKPKTQKFIVQFFKDASTLRQAIEKGEVDIAFRTLSPADVKSLKTSAAVKVLAGPGNAPIRYMVFNHQIPPFDNKLVRQAIAAAIDRSEIRTKVFLGDLAQELYSQVPIGFFGHIDAFKDRYGDKPNIARARELLQQAGYGETKKLEIELWYTTIRYCPCEGDAAALLKQQLEATGMVSVTLKNADWASYRKLRTDNKLGLSLWGWFPDFLDSDNYVRPFFHSSGNKWLRVHYANSKVDKLIDDQILQTTEQRRNTLTEVQRTVADEAPIIPLWQEGQVAVFRGNVKGIILDATNIFRYWLIAAEES